MSFRREQRSARKAKKSRYATLPRNFRAAPSSAKKPAAGRGGGGGGPASARKKHGKIDVQHYTQQTSEAYSDRFREVTFWEIPEFVDEYVPMKIADKLKTRQEQIAYLQDKGCD